MYQEIFSTANLVFGIVFALALVLLIPIIIAWGSAFTKGKRFPDAKQKHKFAILIPARNESKVVENLLQSIQAQDYDKQYFTSYVIVESTSDPTCEIVKKYPNTEIVVRQHLEKVGKGAALDEAWQEIKNKGLEYEAYVIIDADNTIAEDFMTEMNKAYDAGYDICVGSYHSKEWNKSWVANCSSMTFSLVHTFHNKYRSKIKHNVLINGTGLYIASRVLEQVGGYKFQTLTEDYELSLYSVLHNLNTIYNEYAVYYDTPPTNMRTSWTQRVRWITGHNQADKMYNRKLYSKAFKGDRPYNTLDFKLSILSIAVMAVVVIVYILFMLILGIVAGVNGALIWRKIMAAAFFALAATYLVFVLISTIVLIAERKNINIKFTSALTTVLLNPVFLASWMPIFIQGATTKDKTWHPVERE